MTDSDTKCVSVVHESMAVQTHVQTHRCSLHVNRMPGSVKKLHNNIYLINYLYDVACVYTGIN